MTTNNLINLYHICYTLPTNQRALFNELTLTFQAGKTGLIGKNGVGKSTLLKMIAGLITPDSGRIECSASLGYCPQLTSENSGTVADLLGIAPKLKSLENIQQGSINEDDFSILNDDWDIGERSEQQLTNLGLSYLSLDHQVQHLSGGEKTRIMLAKAFIQSPDFLILDEPTNNLDKNSRDKLYKAIQDWKKNLIVVSHDRTLQNIMTQIIELTSLGAETYGGNYDSYVIQKEIKLAALEQDVTDAKKKLSSTKNSIQQSYEKREQKQSKGRKLFLTGKIDRLTANSKKGRSERTQGKQARLADTIQKKAEDKLSLAKSKLETNLKIEVSLPKTNVPSGKIVLEIKELSYQFSPSNKYIINKFNLLMMGPERIAITGPNGCGKSTLVKLIQGIYKPTKGVVYVGVEQISYLDQYAHTLKDEDSLIDNFLRLNPRISEQDAHHFLAKFLFRNVTALKKIKDLSGGERLRAMLACILMSENPPQLLILDEPTNHLDIDSINSIEEIVNQYEGALIVISHDSSFLNNIGVQRYINSPF